MFMHRFCCCGGCEIGFECEYCEANTAPLSFIVTLTGVTLCTECIYRAANDVYSTFAINSGDINGAYTCIQRDPLDLDDTCVWIGGKTIDMEMQDYTAAGCGTPDGSPLPINLRAVLRRKATEWHLTVIASVASTAPHATGLVGVLFDDTLAVDELISCTTVDGTFTNALGSCGTGGFTDYSYGTIGGVGLEVIGTGGTATAVCVP